MPPPADRAACCSAGSACWWEPPKPTRRSRTSCREERCTTVPGPPRAATRSPSTTPVSAAGPPPPPPRAPPGSCEARCALLWEHLVWAECPRALPHTLLPLLEVTGESGWLCSIALPRWCSCSHSTKLLLPSLLPPLRAAGWLQTDLGTGVDRSHPLPKSQDRLI